MHSQSTVVFSSLALLVFCQNVGAECPIDVVVQDDLTCSSDIVGSVDHQAESHLGGECDAEACYTCGDPYDNEEQIAPEATYSFTCQLSGTVSLQITDLPCDLDIYVLDDSCDPYAGCLYGSTQPYAVDDGVDFTCTPGEIYYIVVEAYGTEHLDVASGPCTDDETPEGTVYSPSYTLSFDVSASTGCAEDCDNGEDDDLDGYTDCEDTDCWVEPLCCDIDGDGFFAEECDGDDCDDSNASVHPGAYEDGGTGTHLGDGLDNDCDDLIDEGTDSFDDDQDGFSEVEGDCDDEDPYINPDAVDIPGNDIDEDCDGDDTELEAPIDTGELSDSGANEDTGKDSGSCGCINGNSRAAWILLFLPALAWRRRR